MAGIFGGGACQRNVHFLLGEVLGLEKGNALLEGRAGNRRVL
jgi:hypothetical protein